MGVKTSRVGGLSNAIDIHNLCNKKGVLVLVGGMLESAVGQSFSLALATMSTNAYPSDILPSSRFFERDISSPKIVLSSPGNVSAPDDNGAGFSPDIDLIRKSLVNFSSLSV